MHILIKLICRSLSVVCVVHPLWMCRTHFTQTKISKRMCPSPTIVTRTIETATDDKYNNTIPHLRVKCPHDCVANVFLLPIAIQSRFSFRYSFSFCFKQNCRNDQFELWCKNWILTPTTNRKRTQNDRSNYSIVPFRICFRTTWPWFGIKFWMNSEFWWIKWHHSNARVKCEKCLPELQWNGRIVAYNDDSMKDTTRVKIDLFPL